MRQDQRASTEVTPPEQHASTEMLRDEMRQSREEAAHASGDRVDPA